MKSRILEVLLKQQSEQIKGRTKVCVVCGKEKDADYDFYPSMGRGGRNKTICCDCQKEEGRKLIEEYKAAGCDTAKMPPREKREDEQETN